MNRKVLTLCAGFLLAGGMYANAQYVKVDPANLVDGQYVLANAAGDSIVAFTEGAANTWDSVVVKKGLVSSANAENLVQFAQNPSNAKQWTLSYNGRTIYVHSDGVAYTGEGTQLVALNAQDSLATFQTASNGSITDGTPAAKKYLTRVADAVKGFDKAYAGSQFALYAKLAEAPAGEAIADIAETAQTFLLMIDNQYVGLASGTTRAAVANDSGLTLVNEKPANEDGFVWVEEAGAYKNLKSGKYLAVTKNKELTLVETATTENAISYNGNGLLIGETLVGSGMVLQSNTPMPITASYNAAKTDATSVVLYTNNNTVIAADGSIDEGYNANSSLETVWTLKAVAVGSAVGDNQKYEVRLYNAEVEDNDGYLVVDGNIVTVEQGNGVSVDKDGKITLPADGAIILKAGDEYVTIENGALTTTSVKGQAVEFGLGQIEIANVYVKDLLPRGAEFFNVTITYLKDTDDETDLTSIFAGNLTPYSYINYDGGDIDKTLSGPYDTRFMLMNGDGKILAANTDPDARLSEGEANHVYPLTLIDPSDLMNDIKEGGKHFYKVWFTIEYTPGKDATTAGAFGVTDIKVYTGNGDVRTDSENWQTIGCYLDKTVPTLAAAAGATLKDVTIELNASKVVNAQNWLNKPAYYTVEVANTNKKAAHYGKVLGLNASGLINYVDPAKTNIELPEGQFSIEYVYQDAKGEDLEYPYYKFTNRETGNSITDYRNGNPVEFKLDASSLYSVDGGTTFAYRHGGYMDTLVIKAVTDYKSEDGFKRFTAEDLNANTYNISMPILNGPLYVIENHNDRHRVGLDAEEATDWRIEMSTVRMMDAANDLVRVVPDTVSVPTGISYYVANVGWVKTDDATGKYKKYYDANTELQIPTYILKNTATNEYLDGKDYEEEVGNAYYVCNEDERTATRVALKLVGDSTINLIPVMGQSNYDEVAEEYKNDWFAGIEIKESAYDTYANALTLQGQKIIGGTTVATGVLHDVTRFQSTDNDLFVITPSDARTYALLEQGENIILMREKNNDEVVYEDGEFAGIDNRLAYEDINPTLYVDTAYVDRAGNYKYQYLLMVQPSLSNEWYCPYNEEHNTEAWKEENGVDHCADAVRTDRIDGRFLVNMRDSADANEDVHNNKFEYDGESKLALVPGYHQNDTLYLTNEAGEVIAKSEVGNSAAHYAKFAFKMINEDQNEFVVEVGEGFTEQTTVTYKGGNRVSETSKGEPTVGYLRWHNGNLVVTPNLDQAEHFTMEASELQATANEEISAESTGVSVVATDGAVVIKGAEGKNVVIATILGKVVANETINSDNETIAVPAGIAVVSVDGESFKVVVK